jgi:hypothetical protein
LLLAFSSACLFPSLDLTGGDAGGDASVNDVATDAPLTDAGADVQADAKGDGAFTAGIGCAAATPDLLAYYTMDEGTGTIVHDCIASPTNDGTIMNSSHTAWVTGQHGKALELDLFDGGCANTEFDTPNYSFGGTNAASFTVSLWIDVVTLPPNGEIGYIAGYSSNISQGGWRLSIGMGGGIIFAVPNGSGGTTNVVGAQIAAGAWHHIAAVYGGASSGVYVDGAGTVGPLPTTWATDMTTGDRMRMGCSADNQHPLNARLDDVRFYNRALSAAEVLIVKNAN